MELRPMIIGDLEAVLEILKSDNRLAFEPWEDHLLRLHAKGKNNDLRSYLSTIDDEIVGLVFFGFYGEFASINHIWVSERQRKTGVAIRLLQKALEDCSGKMVHLMTVNGNEQANAFFEGAGFTSDKGFWEMDIESAPEEEPCPSTNVPILGLRGCLHTLPKETDWGKVMRAFSEKGIGRIHFIPPPEFSDTARLTAMGFQRPEGETLWMKQV